MVSNIKFTSDADLTNPFTWKIHEFYEETDPCFIVGAMSAETYDFLVIGGGVIGTAIARYPDRLDILCALDTACIAFIVHCRMVDVDVDVQI